MNIEVASARHGKTSITVTITGNGPARRYGIITDDVNKIRSFYYRHLRLITAKVRRASPLHSCPDCGGTTKITNLDMKAPVGTIKAEICDAPAHVGPGGTIGFCTWYQEL